MYLGFKVSPKLLSLSFLVIGESEAHKHLLTNPVISLFINLKWQKIAPIYSNYQRFLYFFYMILTWYIVAMFGGMSTRKLGGFQLLDLVIMELKIHMTC